MARFLLTCEAGAWFRTPGNAPSTLRGRIVAAGASSRRTKEADRLQEKIGAVEKTRTSTASRPQRPQRCASTSSATTALSSSERPTHAGGVLALKAEGR